MCPGRGPAALGGDRDMKHLHTALTVVALVTGTSLTASADTLGEPYDPVARAIALGLTPEAADAAFDRALASAERCDALAVAMQTMSCASRDVATVDLPATPPLES